MTVQCPNCNHWNEEDANFCEEGGFELKNADRQSKPVSVKPVSAPVTAVPPAPPELPPAPSTAGDDVTASLPYTGARFRRCRSICLKCLNHRRMNMVVTGILLTPEELERLRKAKPDQP